MRRNFSYLYAFADFRKLPMRRDRQQPRPTGAADRPASNPDRNGPENRGDHALLWTARQVARFDAKGLHVRAASPLWRRKPPRRPQWIREAHHSGAEALKRRAFVPPPLILAVFLISGRAAAQVSGVAMDSTKGVLLLGSPAGAANCAAATNGRDPLQ